MKATSLLILILVLPFYLHAQSIAWMNAYHTGTVRDMDAHPDGRTVTAINNAQDVVYNAEDGQPILGATFTTNMSWIFSMDSNGVIEWTIPFYFPLYSFDLGDVELAADGSLYVCGATTAETDLDPGTGVFNLTTAASGFLAKYSAVGEFLWAIPVGDFDAYSANYISIDNDGNILMTGYFSGSFDFDPGSAQSVLSAIGGNNNTYIAKYAPTGELLWAKAIRSSNDVYASAIAVNDLGNLMVGGTFSVISFNQAPLDLDPGSGQFNVLGYADGSGSAFFVMLNADGEFLNGYGIEENTIVTPVSISATQDNGFVVLGEYSRDFDADFSAATVTVPSVGPMNYMDIFILKLNQNFGFEWVNRMGNGIGNHGGYCIRESPQGELLASGFSGGGAIDIDPGSAVFNVEGGSINTTTSFLLRMEADGSFLWGEQLSDSAICTLKALDFLSNGDVIVALNAGQEVTFSPHINYSQTLYDPAAFYTYIFMIGKIGYGVPTTFGSLNHESLVLFPQPASNQLTIEGNFKTPGAYHIVDVHGKLVLADELRGSLIHIETLTPGYYVLVLEDSAARIPFVKCQE